jgi:membrane-bound serine protease (ClpP class)
MYELSAPGVGIGGLTAGLCFALFFWSRVLGGTAGWLEVLLFSAGIIFLAVELFVIPGFGITGITGILLMLAAVVLASQEFALPTTNAQLITTSTSTLTTLLAGVIGFIVCAITLRHMEAIPVLNRLMLKPPRPDIATEEVIDSDGKSWPAADASIQIGDWGVATTLLRPGGKAQFGDLVLDVVSEGAFIQPDVQVRIVEMQGHRIVVEKAI